MPAAKPEIVVLTPVPVAVAPPGLVVKIHVPDAGKPFKVTLPVDTEQVGCTIVPTEGGVGAPGAVGITTSVEAVEVQPAEFVTVNV